MREPWAACHPDEIAGLLYTEAPEMLSEVELGHPVQRLHGDRGLGARDRPEPGGCYVRA